MNKKFTLFATFGIIGFLTSCATPINCPGYVTNTYDDYESFIDDVEKQKNISGLAFYFLDIGNVLNKEYVSNPSYILSGIDYCTSCGGGCKKENGHILSAPLYPSYQDTIIIEPGREWDSPYVASDLTITIDFIETRGEMAKGPSNKIPSSVEWEDVRVEEYQVRRSYKYGDYLNAEFKYLTVGQLNPTDDERYLVDKIGGIVEDIKNTIKNALLTKYGEEN